MYPWYWTAYAIFAPSVIIVLYFKDKIFCKVWPKICFWQTQSLRNEARSSYCSHHLFCVFYIDSPSIKTDQDVLLICLLKEIVNLDYLSTNYKICFPTNFKVDCILRLLQSGIKWAKQSDFNSLFGIFWNALIKLYLSWICGCICICVYLRIFVCTICNICVTCSLYLYLYHIHICICVC